MNLYWIKEGKFQIAIMARPRGGDWLPDDIDFAQKAGIQAIVSALTQGEMEELALTEEQSYCVKQGIKFYGFPIEDRSVPETSPDFDAFLEILNTELQAGLPIAIHCRAGIGRSSLIAACLLIRQGVYADDAIASIEAARGCLIPDTPEQRRWIKKFGCRKQSELQS
jgi:protein-tyrosine phosphatase